MKNKFLKGLGFVFSAIILGAIGSGVWSEFISPIWNIFVDITVRIFSFLSESFKDSVYSNASKGFHEEFSLVLFSVVVGFISGLAFTALLSRISSLFKKTGGKIDNFMFSKKLLIILSFFVLVFFIMTSFYLFRASYVNKITTSSLNSIDIISPYVGIQKTLELRSKFHKIKNSADYKQFYQEMKVLNEEYKVDFTLFEPL
jgi:hypothetical protein